MGRYARMGTVRPKYEFLALGFGKMHFQAGKMHYFTCCCTYGRVTMVSTFKYHWFVEIIWLPWQLGQNKQKNTRKTP